MMSGQTLKRAAMSFKDNTGVGVVGLDPRTSMNLSDELREEMGKFLH